MTPASEPPARVVFSVTMGVSTSAALGRRSQVFTIEDCWTIGICEAARRELRHPTLLMGEASHMGLRNCGSTTSTPRTSGAIRLAVGCSRRSS